MAAAAPADAHAALWIAVRLSTAVIAAEAAASGTAPRGDGVALWGAILAGAAAQGMWSGTPIGWFLSWWKGMKASRGATRRGRAARPGANGRFEYPIHAVHRTPPPPPPHPKRTQRFDPVRLLEICLRLSACCCDICITPFGTHPAVTKHWAHCRGIASAAEGADERASVAARSGCRRRPAEPQRDAVATCAAPACSSGR